MRVDDVASNVCVSLGGGGIADDAGKTLAEVGIDTYGSPRHRCVLLVQPDKKVMAASYTSKRGV